MYIYLINGMLHNSQELQATQPVLVFVQLYQETAVKGYHIPRVFSYQILNHQDMPVLTGLDCSCHTSLSHLVSFSLLQEYEALINLNSMQTIITSFFVLLSKHFMRVYLTSTTLGSWSQSSHTDQLT